jgi:hypothetical protein
MTEFRIYFTDGKSTSVDGHTITVVREMPPTWRKILRWEISEKTGRRIGEASTVAMFNTDQVKWIMTRDVQNDCE